MKINFFILVLIAALPSCDNKMSANQHSLDDNTDKWQTANIDHYRFVYHKYCFCPTEETSEVNIEVNNDQIIAIQNRENGVSLDSSMFPYFHTVGELFTLVQDAIDDDAYKLSVTYDVQFGYPANIDIDYDKYAIDEELKIIARDLEVL